MLVRFVTAPAEIADADLVILPGSRATVADLAWLRERGLAGAVAERAARGGPVLGICGGYQMLAAEIRDDVESGAGLVPGLGLLPATVTFGAAKVLRLCQETSGGEPVTGYEIHHGVVTAAGGEPFPGGCSAGAVLWHHVARHPRERRVPQGAAAPGRRGGRAFVRARRHHVRGRCGSGKLDTLADLVDAHAGHGRPAGPDRPRRARRAPVHPARSPMSENPSSC